MRQRVSGVGDDIGWQHQISALYAVSVGTLDRGTMAAFQPQLLSYSHLMHTQNSSNAVTQTCGISHGSSPGVMAATIIKHHTMK